MGYAIQALKAVQADRPAYKSAAGNTGGDPTGFWSEVILKTAVGAGANTEGRHDNVIAYLDATIPAI